MLSVEPILERTLRASAAGAVPGRVAVLEAAVAVVEKAARGARGTVGFFSGTVPEDGAAGLAAVSRVREALVVVVVVVVAPALRVVVVLGLVESAERKKASLISSCMCFIVGESLPGSLYIKYN